MAQRAQAAQRIWQLIDDFYTHRSQVIADITTAAVGGGLSHDDIQHSVVQLYARPARPVPTVNYYNFYIKVVHTEMQQANPSAWPFLTPLPC
jgi:hypothetical protein